MLDRILRFNEFERDRFVERWAGGLSAGSRVLDVGAGPCRYRPLFAHCEYKTQDFGGHEGSAAGPLADRDTWRYGQIDFRCDASSIPVPEASFDAVLCTEVLEHVPDPAAVVRELGRILRNGGQLLVTAPLGSGLHQEPDHYYGGYTPFWYRKFLPDAGFESLTIEANGGFFKHYGQESRRFSAFIDPRRVCGLAKVLLFPFWLLTLPWFRLLLPLACHAIDRIDTHRGFTVGYHVLAVRRTR